MPLRALDRDEHLEDRGGLEGWSGRQADDDAHQPADLEEAAFVVAADPPDAGLVLDRLPDGAGRRTRPLSRLAGGDATAGPASWAGLEAASWKTASDIAWQDAVDLLLAETEELPFAPRERWSQFPRLVDPAQNPGLGRTRHPKSPVIRHARCAVGVASSISGLPRRAAADLDAVAEDVAGLDDRALLAGEQAAEKFTSRSAGRTRI